VNLTQIAKVARREYFARVKNKAFIAMTVLMPAFLGLYMFSVPLLARPGTRNLRVAVIDAGTGLGQPLADRLRSMEGPSISVTDVVRVDPTDGAARERFGAAVRSRALDGYLLVETNARSSFDRFRTTLSSAERPALDARYFARETGNPALMRELRLAVQSVALERLLDGTGVDINEVRKAQQLTLDSVTILDRGERAGGFQAAFASTMVLGMLLYVAVLINGQGMATAIVEEKSSRLIEVILGAVTATEFMTGKILGVLGSGLTQLAIWIAVLMIALLQAAGSGARCIDAGVRSVGRAERSPDLLLRRILLARVSAVFGAVRRRRGDVHEHGGARPVDDGGRAADGHRDDGGLERHRESCHHDDAGAEPDSVLYAARDAGARQRPDAAAVGGVAQRGDPAGRVGRCRLGGCEDLPLRSTDDRQTPHAAGTDAGRQSRLIAAAQADH
jgi:ABC-type Na+ efflux pump permease subunit